MKRSVNLKKCGEEGEAPCRGRGKAFGFVECLMISIEQKKAGLDRP